MQVIAYRFLSNIGERDLFISNIKQNTNLMKKNIYLLIYVLFCFGCQQNSTSTAFSGNPKYKTTDPARLYFNNIRSIAYYKTRKPHSKIDIYQLKKKAQTVDRPIIHRWIDLLNRLDLAN